MALMSHEESYWLNKTLPELLRQNVEKASEAPALMWNSQVMNWAELDLVSDRLAAGLADLGMARAMWSPASWPTFPSS